MWISVPWNHQFLVGAKDRRKCHREASSSSRPFADVQLILQRGANMAHLLRNLWSPEEGQDIAEYAVMLAVILVLVVGTIRLVGSNANNAFSSVASSIQ